MIWHHTGSTPGFPALLAEGVNLKGGVGVTVQAASGRDSGLEVIIQIGNLVGRGLLGLAVALEAGFPIVILAIFTKAGCWLVPTPRTLDIILVN
jgi:hypothetical protein